METRAYDFVTGIESASAPTPTAPSGDSSFMTKGYADDTYALRSSWMDKAADNTAVKAIVSADRSNGQIVFNYGTDSFYKFDSGSSATDDDDLVLQPSSGTGRWLKVSTGGGSSSGENIVQNLDTSASTSIVSGEDIADRNAVCIEMHNGSGSDVLRIFKCDSDLNARRSFVGFASAAATGTTGSYTYTINAAYVASNSIPIIINGRTYTATYASSSDATLQALATLIGGDQDVTSAVVTVVGGNQTGTDDRVITITPKGHLALNITGTTITGGASQPGVTIANPTPPAGANVDITQFGPMSGFSGLVAGEPYYLSATAGAITVTPTDGNNVYVGRALTTTVLFVDPMGVSKIWGSSKVAVVSHGLTGDASSSTQDVEMFNFSSWTSGTSAALGVRGRAHSATANYATEHVVVDGNNSSNASAALHATYNKAAWTSRTAPATARSNRGIANFAGLLQITHGAADGNVSNNSDVGQAWNGASWASKTSYANTLSHTGTFITNSLLDSIGGFDGGSGATNHHATKNTSDTLSSATVLPINTCGNSGANQTSTLGVLRTSAGGGSDNAQAYTWNGSAWSSALTMNRTCYAQRVAACAFAENKNLYFENGGRVNGSSTTLSTSEVYNGTAFSASTSSTNARNSACGSYT